MNWKKLLWILLGAGTVEAYTNDTMTPSFLLLHYGNPIYAILQLFEDTMGAEWFYIGLALGPWTGLYLYQRDIHLPTLWLTSVVIAYGTLFAVPVPIFYMIGVMWVLSVFYKVMGSKYSW